MQVKFEKSWGMSKAGYYHCPIIYFAFGNNGFTLTILGGNILITW